jgi:hypothetical protein
VDEKVSFMNKDVACYGTIVTISNEHHECMVKFLNDYGEEEGEMVDFVKLSKISEEIFEQKKQEQEQYLKEHTFQVGDSVNFVLMNSKLEKIGYVGKVTVVDSKSHQATIQYLDKENIEKVAKVDILKISKVKN